MLVCAWTVVNKPILRPSRIMGNVHSGSALTRTTVALDSFVGELGGDIIFEKR